VIKTEYYFLIVLYDELFYFAIWLIHMVFLFFIGSFLLKRGEVVNRTYWVATRFSVLRKEGFVKKLLQFILPYDSILLTDYVTENCFFLRAAILFNGGSFVYGKVTGKAPKINQTF